MDYDLMHRFFLRTVASQGVLQYSNAQHILEASFPNRTNISVDDVVKKINNKIRPFQQEIKIVIDEVTSEKNVVFLSLGFDDATKSQDMFSPHELNYFRSLIEQIMTTESRQITSQYALNLVNTLMKVSKPAAQKLLSTWCRMHYLEKVDSNYALGIRAIHEFQDYLRTNMPDTIQLCCLCKKIVFRGYNCPPCGKAVHLRCLSEFLQTVSKWPCCEADFDEKQLDTLISSGLPPTQQLEESQRSTQRGSRRPSGAEETIMDNSDDEFEQTVSTPIPGVSQRISRKRKRLSRLN